jgi:hypothetical protein
MLKYFFIFIIILNSFLMAQYKDFTNQLNSSYESFREESLKNRRFKHKDIKPLIENLRKNNLFRVKQLGYSAQHREIYLISIGTGSTKLFLWSQMHGDEPTATIALFDIFNFFSKANQFEDFKKEILQKLTIYFIPMINPDGAEVYERRNIYQIDLNRDAERLQTPEGKILKDTFDSLKADFGFNLHDQNIYYSAGKSFKSAAISFLAPEINTEKTINPVRYRAMQLIGQLKDILEDFIPGHIGRYSDEFEPRAFGDNFQKWGTSTILIETGGWKDDPEKQFLRKINFITFLAAFKSIAEGDYKNESLETYDNMPLNEEDHVMDLILRNLSYKIGDKTITVDIGINRTEVNTDSARNFYLDGKVVDIGDLSIYSGYEDYDLSGMEIAEGKTYEDNFSSFEELKKLNFTDLYSGGYTDILITFPVKEEHTRLPINLVLSNKRKDGIIRVDTPANFYITHGGKVKYVVVNGFLIETAKPQTDNVNGSVIH